MKNQFDILKNGNVATTVWAKIETKEIYSANKNSFGYNALQAGYDSDFYKKYGKNMKLNQGKSNYSKFSYSAKSMNEAGFVLVMRGQKPLW
jgi:hypothetical protein